MAKGHDSKSTLSRFPQAPLLVRLGLELAVIFIGVYAAFALSEYESRREDAMRRSQLQAALVREIQDITSNTERVAAFLPAQLTRFDSVVAAGGRPRLEPWIETAGIQTHMWQATLQSGALEIFDVATVYQLSQFYNELNMGFAQLDQLRDLSETVLIPNMDQSIDEFYEPQTRQLRPKYGWYRAGLGRLSELAASITALGDSVVTALQSESGSP